MDVNGLGMALYCFFEGFLRVSDCRTKKPIENHPEPYNQIRTTPKCNGDNYWILGLRGQIADTCNLPAVQGSQQQKRGGVVVRVMGAPLVRANVWRQRTFGQSDRLAKAAVWRPLMTKSEACGAFVQKVDVTPLVTEQTRRTVPYQPGTDDVGI